MPDTTTTTPSTLHPEALIMLDAMQQELAAFALAKLNLEYRVQKLKAKGIVPHEDGTASDELAVDDAGKIGGSQFVFTDYRDAMLGLAALVSAIEQPLPTGPTVENALLRFSRGR